MNKYASRLTLTGLPAHKLSTLRVPVDVVDEMILASTRPRSLTAEILGDPLPGRSALDKRQPPNLAEPPPISAVVKVGLSR